MMLLCKSAIFPILIGTIIVFLIINLILLPLTYVKSIIVKIQVLFDKKTESPTSKRVIVLLIFISLGWTVVMINLGVELYAFVLHLYESDVTYRKEKSNIQYISSETYKKLQNKFWIDYEEKIEAVTFIEMSTYSRDMMKITPILRALLFARQVKNMDFKKQIFTLQEYSRIKDTLDSGSIKINNCKLIFPMI